MIKYGDAVLRVITHVCVKYGKAYCFPTQETILQLLAKFQKIRISRRTLNRVMKYLQAYGYFNRIKRHYRSKTGELVLRSTLYLVRGKLIAWVYKMKCYTKKILSFFAVSQMAQYNLSRLLFPCPQGTLLTNNQQTEQQTKGFSYNVEGAEAEDYIKSFYRRRPDLV